MTVNELKNILIQCDFDPREATFYLEMVKKTEIQAGELHRKTGIARPRTYEIISAMLSKGYCTERSEGKYKYYSAVKPSQLLATLERKWKQEQEEAREVLEDLDKTYERGRKNDRSIDFIEVIRSRDLINQRYIQLVSETEKELLAFVRTPYSAINEKSRKAQLQAFELADKKGVSYKTLTMYEEDTWEWIKDGYGKDQPLRKNEEGRIIEHIPIKMFIFDRKKVLLAIPSIPGEREGDFTMVVIEDDGNAEAYSQLFDMYWEKAYTYEEFLKTLDR